MKILLSRRTLVLAALCIACWLVGNSIVINIVSRNAPLTSARYNDAEKALLAAIKQCEAHAGGSATRELADAYARLVDFYFEHSQFEKAAPFIESQLRVLRASSEPGPDRLSRLAGIFRDAGKLDAARKLYNEVLHMAERSGDNALEARMLNNLGTVVFLDARRSEQPARSRLFAEAEAMYRKALDLCRRTNDEALASTVQENYRLLLLETGRVKA